MNYLHKYEKWLNDHSLASQLREELLAIKDNEKEIEARFYQELAFGTGGLRGIIGAGVNRMNIYTIRKTTQGLANYLKKVAQGAGPRAVIAYDSRRMSREFAVEAALVLARNGIKAFLFPEITATPILSFAVRELQAAGGIVITASHNPPEYNGYKVYGADGGQITDEAAQKITAEIALIANELAVPAMEFEEAMSLELLQYLDESIINSYSDKLRGLALNSSLFREEAKDFKLVFSPLHGTGKKPVTSILEKLGFENIYLVPEQEHPDSEFPTVKYPNPEEPEAFALAIKLGEELAADVLVATDPDADRLGAAVKNHQGKYVILTGNQLGALMLEYILSQQQEQGSLPENGVVIKTIVTSEIGSRIANNYGLETIDTLTGFKYIGEKIKEFHEQGNKQFIFGYEESYGYLIGDFVRDKDAVQASLLTAEMALFYKTKGLTLYEKLADIFTKYGFYKEDLVSFTLEGKEGQEQIKLMMDAFRREGLTAVAGQQVLLASDYLRQKAVSLEDGREKPTGLPPANVLKYNLADNSWFCIRPSGTEPKIKIYFGVCEQSQQAADDKLSHLQQGVLQLLARQIGSRAFI